MKTITAEQKRALEDLSAQGLLGNLPIQTAEKDIHITDLLRELSQFQVEHGLFSDLQRGEAVRHDPGIRLVFGGGTCLSKAHGLIHRMSEDIDFKIILTAPSRPLRAGRGDRARLKALHEQLAQLLERNGFPLLAHADNPLIRDAHRYYQVDAGYRSPYGPLSSLRPELKLEFIERAPLLPLEACRFGYLYESLAGLELSQPVTIECISVAETAAEKVLSLLRRCAWSWDGHQRGEADPALVRHVYDVACIADRSAHSLEAARAIFPRLVLGDRDEFRGQHPEFDRDPVGVLRRTLVAARSSPTLATLYQERVLPLVFEADRPSFSDCFTKFEQVASAFLSACTEPALARAALDAVAKPSPWSGLRSAVRKGPSI